MRDDAFPCPMEKAIGYESRVYTYTKLYVHNSSNHLRDLSHAAHQHSRCGAVVSETGTRCCNKISYSQNKYGMPHSALEFHAYTTLPAAKNKYWAMGRSNHGHTERHRNPGWSSNLSAIGGHPALAIGAHLSPPHFRQHERTIATRLVHT
jgi:hypothetical protein